MKYLRIDDDNLEVLKGLNGMAAVDFDVFDTPLDIFENEEAKYRLEEAENEQGRTIEDETIRGKILTEIQDEISKDNYIDSDKLSDITYVVIKKNYPELYFSDDRYEIEKLVREDYAVRNTDPHFLRTKDSIIFFSKIDGELVTDSSFEFDNWGLSAVEARLLMLKYGFKEVGGAN